MIAQADPQLLFQRIIMVAGRMTENVGQYFPVCERQINRYLLIQSGLSEEGGGGGDAKTKREDDVICHVLVGGSLIQ